MSDADRSIPDPTFMPRPPRLRLGAMMFLQYAVWGIWMPILPVYLRTSVSEGGLGFTDYQIGMIAAVAASLGAMAGPFIAGQFADRYFATERYLAAVMVLGGITNWILAGQTTFTAWMLLSIVYALLYMPTLGLTNSLAMAHLSDTKRQFARVRLWGTIGWIAAGWGFSMFWLVDRLQFRWLPPFFEPPEMAQVTPLIVDALKASGILSIGYGLFALFLPHTPPKRDAVQRLAFAEAFGLIRRRSVLVLVFVGLAIAAVHKIYFLQTGPYLRSIGLDAAFIMPAMSIAQFAEIFIMAGLGVMLAGLGFRWVLFLGAFGYFLRFAIFGTTDLPVSVIVTSQLLHGFCFACFYAASFIYIDRIAPPDVRNSAQTAYLLVVLGIGPIIGGWLNGYIGAAFLREDGSLDYQGFWYTCAAIGLVGALATAALFRDQTVSRDGPDGPLEVRTARK